MRHSLLAATVLLSLGACTATTATSRNSAADVTPPVASVTSAAPSPTSSAVTWHSASTVPASVTSPSLNGGTFDVLPAGYTYAYLSRLTKIGGRWAVVLDPLTMCTFGSKDPNCAYLTEPPPNDYEIKNISTKTYVVPLASGTVLSVIGASGQPGDFVTVPMAEKTWASDQVIVEYTVNTSQQVATIKEWWHP